MNPPTSHQKQPNAGEAQEEWSTGLFDCFSDLKNTFITCCCPCVTSGQVAAVVGKGSTSCVVSGALYVLLRCLYSGYIRTKMRRQYKLEGTPAFDWLVHCCCDSCALCQEYRELQNRGYDMTIDWHGNVDQLKRGVGMTATAPAVQPMTR